MSELSARVLVGGTASGKKTLALELFRRHGLAPLSMDSIKVYRGMDIGTDKPSPAAVREAGWGLLDLAGHHETFTAGRWLEAALAEVRTRDAPLLFAGGTPLYLRLLLRGLFPGPPADLELRAELEARWDAEGEAAVRRELAQVDPEIERRLAAGDQRRVVRALEVQRLTGRTMSSWQREETRPPLPGRLVVVALRHERQAHLTRLAQRVERMFAAGLPDEVRALQSRAPFGPEAGRAIGYAECLALLAGELTQQAAVERVVVRTRQLARKQRIFLAGFPEIRWVDIPAGAGPLDVLEPVEQALELDVPA